MHGKLYVLCFCFCFIAGAANAGAPLTTKRIVIHPEEGNLSQIEDYPDTRLIDMDYYLGLLRSFDCTSEHAQQNCQNYCKGVPALCHEGECYCHRSVVGVRNSPDIPVHSDEKKEDEPEIMLTSYALRPAPRHHIAHFCPDLDKARECIRTCMEVGKPAFCGKDHTCYCGHRYGSHDTEIEQDALETYKHFKDMYAKYLGVSEYGHRNSEEDDYGREKLHKKSKGR